ncbi:hypothetical protein V6N13_130034 [Hibiscus sabdariffa]
MKPGRLIQATPMDFEVVECLVLSREIPWFVFGLERELDALEANIERTRKIERLTVRGFRITGALDALLDAIIFFLLLALCADGIGSLRAYCVDGEGGRLLPADKTSTSSVSATRISYHPRTERAIIDGVVILISIQNWGRCLKRLFRALFQYKIGVLIYRANV